MASKYDIQGPSGKVITIEADDEETAKRGAHNYFSASQQPESRAGSMIMGGLTFGTWPRINAAVRSGAVSGPEYEKIRDENWRKDDAYRRANPWTAMVLEMGGSLPTMAIPGLNAARLAQASQGVARGFGQLSNAQRLGRIAGVGRNTVGSVGHEAGVLGAKYAGLYGAGASREDDSTGRLMEGATYAPLGYAGGRVFNALTSPFVRTAERGRDIGHVGRHGEYGALTAMRRDIESSGMSMDDMWNRFMPQTGRMRMPEGSPRVILETYYNALESGANAQAARQAARQAYRQFNRDVADDTIDNHISRMIRSFEREHTNVPLSLDETLNLDGGGARSLEWTRRYAANSAGEGGDQLRTTTLARQQDILPTVREFTNQRFGSPDILGQKAEIVARNRANERALYGAARANEMPFDLEDVARELWATEPFRGGRAGDTMRQAAEVMGLMPDATGRFPRMTLDQFIQRRGKLNDLIDGSYNVDGLAQRRATTATRDLRDLKSKLDDIVQEVNPRWRLANDITAGGRSIADAVDMGARMSLDAADNNTLQVLQHMQKLRAEANALMRLPGSQRGAEQTARLGFLKDYIDAYRLGFSRVLHKKLDKMGDTHDISKAFLKGGRRSESGTRNVIDVMMGEDAPEFMRMIERARQAASTFRTYGQSQTTPLREHGEGLNIPSRVAGMMKSLGYIARPQQFFEDVGSSLAELYQRGRNAQLGRRFSVLSDEPGAMFNLLREIEEHGAQRSPAFTNELLNWYSAPGIGYGAFSGAYTQDQMQENPYYADRRPLPF